MNDLFTASRTAELAQGLFAKVKPTTLHQFLADGNSRHYNVDILPIQGVLEGTLETETMVYKPIEDSDVFIPDWVQERINWATTNYKVKQIVVGDEKREPPEDHDEINETTEINWFMLKTVAVVVTSTLLAVIAVVGITAVIVALLSVIALAGLLVASAGALLLIDPQVVVILEDDPKENWICVAEWLHSSSQ